MLLMLFIVLAGEGWLLGKGIGNALFPKEKDPMDHWKNGKEPRVANSRCRTHVSRRQNLTVI